MSASLSANLVPGVASEPRPARAEAPLYAPFGRRLAALAVDLVSVGAVLAMFVHLTNAALRPLGWYGFEAFWLMPAVVQVIREDARRDTSVSADGATHELNFAREIRMFADGSVRVYAVAEGRHRSADGATAESRVESLVGENQSAVIRRWLTLALFMIVPLVYFALAESSPAQATAGKRLFGLKVTDSAGGRISLGRAAWRQLMKTLEIASSGITYVIAAFTGRRQALHDMFAGTLVVRA